MRPQHPPTPRFSVFGVSNGGSGSFIGSRSQERLAFDLVQHGSALPGRGRGVEASRPCDHNPPLSTVACRGTSSSPFASLHRCPLENKHISSSDTFPETLKQMEARLSHCRENMPCHAPGSRAVETLTKALGVAADLGPDPMEGSSIHRGFNTCSSPVMDWLTRKQHRFRGYI